SWWRYQNEVVRRRGHRHRADGGAPGHGSTHRAVHRPAQVCDRAGALRRRPEDLERGPPRGHSDEVARGVPGPLAAVALPGDHMIRREHEIEQPRVVEGVVEAQDGRARGQGRGGAAVHEHHGDLGARLGARDHGAGERARVPSHEVEIPRHQNTRYRWALRASSATASAVTGTTAWPSTFQSASLGIGPAMWNGTLSLRSAARNFAMSSPSTRSSVSSSSRWTAGPVSTTITSF